MMMMMMRMRMRMRGDGDNGEAQDDDGEVLPEEEDQPHLLPLASKLGCLTVLTNKLLHNPQIILSLVITLDWIG